MRKTFSAFKKIGHILIMFMVLPILIAMGASSNESPNCVTGSLRRTWKNAGDPVNGTSGTYAGIADAGDILIDTTNKHVFVNVNTQASPTWAMIRAGGPISDKTASVYLTTGDAGIVTVSTDGIYLYLPTYVNNSGLTFLIKQTAAFSAGTVIYTLANEATALDGAARKTCGAQYDVLEVVCGGTGWNIIGKIGTWS